MRQMVYLFSVLEACGNNLKNENSRWLGWGCQPQICDTNCLKKRSAAVKDKSTINYVKMNGVTKVDSDCLTTGHWIGPSGCKFSHGRDTHASCISMKIIISH